MLKLEQHVGRPLFTRGANEYRLNEDGMRLFEELKLPMDQLTAVFERRAAPSRKQLVVGVPTSFATAWLIPRLDRFRQSNPDIDLRIETSGSPIEKLGSTLDMIIFFAEEGKGKIEFQPLRPQGAYVVAREGLVDPLDGLRAALRSTPLLVHRHLPQMLDTWKAEVGLTADFPLNVDTYDDGPLLIAAAQSGLGLALVLEDMENFYGSSTGLVRPFGEYARTSFSYAIATKPASGSVHAIERFRQWVIQTTDAETQSRVPRKKLETV